MHGKQWCGLVFGILALLIGLLAPFDGLSPDAQRALGLALFAILFWTTEPVPLEFSSLLLLLLLPTFGLLSFEESFSPFAGKTIWLIFSGMVLSLGISETRLGDRLAALSLRHLGSTPFRLLLHLHLIGLGTAFLIPSGVVRVLLLFPIGTALARRLDPDKRTGLEAAVLLSLLCSTYFGGCGVFTGAVPNLVVAGQLEKETGQVIYWSTWLMWMFPIIGAFRTALSLTVIWFALGRTLRLPDAPNQTAIQSKLEPCQRRVLAILILGVALWATDVFHRIPPAHVSLVLVLLYLLPGWGPLSVPSLRKINFPFLFYIAALFSLGASLEKSGFNNHLITTLTTLIHLENFGWFGQHLILTLVAVPFDFLMDIAAVAGVITVPLLQFGMSHDLSSLSIAMCVGMATTLVFLPYQAAPFMVAYSFRQFSLGRLIATVLAISLLSLLLLCPLNIAYWHGLGLIH